MIEQPGMTDITSKKVIVLKGILFLLIVIGSSMVILIKQPTLVDPSLRYSGLLALLSALLQRGNSRKRHSHPL